MTTERLTDSEKSLIRKSYQAGETGVITEEKAIKLKMQVVMKKGYQSIKRCIQVSDTFQTQVTGISERKLNKNKQTNKQTNKYIYIYVI